MPKFVGQSILGAIRLEDNLSPHGTERIRLSYSQAKLLPEAEVMKSLDTTDRGGPKSYAKRWNRWFASADSIMACPRSTKLMLAAARRALGAIGAHTADERVAVEHMIEAFAANLSAPGSPS